MAWRTRRVTNSEPDVQLRICGAANSQRPEITDWRASQHVFYSRLAHSQGHCFRAGRPAPNLWPRACTYLLLHPSAATRCPADVFVQGSSGLNPSSRSGSLVSNQWAGVAGWRIRRLRLPRPKPKPKRVEGLLRSRVQDCVALRPLKT